jgi:hypothetical protein
MNAYKVRSIVMADGTIVLKGLPFNAGKSVEVIVLEDSSSQELDPDSIEPTLNDEWQSLKGSVTRYDNPFETAIPSEDWDVITL